MPFLLVLIVGSLIGPLLYLQSSELRKNLVRATWIVFSFMLLIEIVVLSRATYAYGGIPVNVITAVFTEKVTLANTLWDYYLAVAAGDPLLILPIVFLAFAADRTFTDRPPLRWHVLFVLPGVYVLLWVLGAFVKKLVGQAGA